MDFNVSKSIEVLSRTPMALEQMINGLDTEWITINEGPGTWSVYDIIGHLIYGEKTDWVPRMEIILSSKPDKTFEPFDRNAQFKLNDNKPISLLLAVFKQMRGKNIDILISKNLTSELLSKKGIHPAFGEVTLKQLLSSWVVHDLNHVAQISRVMAKQYKSETGPWVEYLPVLK